MKDYYLPLKIQMCGLIAWVLSFLILNFLIRVKSVSRLICAIRSAFQVAGFRVTLPVLMQGL